MEVRKKQKTHQNDISTSCTEVEKVAITKSGLMFLTLLSFTPSGSSEQLAQDLVRHV